MATHAVFSYQVAVQGQSPKVRKVLCSHQYRQTVTHLVSGRWPGCVSHTSKYVLKCVTLGQCRLQQSHGPHCLSLPGQHAWHSWCLSGTIGPPAWCVYTAHQPQGISRSMGRRVFLCRQQRCCSFRCSFSCSHGTT